MPLHKKAAAVSIVFIFVFFVVSSVLYVFAVSAPSRFTEGKIFSVKEGQTLSEISNSLLSAGYIRSAFVFKLIVRGLFLEGTGAVAGDYFFEKPINSVSLAERIVSGDFRVAPAKVTVPEGLNKFEIADILSKQLQHFDSKKFIALAPEGYLFPDTYFFSPTIEPEKIIEIMRANFDTQTEPYLLQIEKAEKNGRSLDDVIKMASIVETEARQTETRRIIAGILWKRIDEKMLLQVDVSFKYINGKGTNELTGTDLEIDSPYNSYKYSGLPPTPIANPGLDSIVAVLSPTESPYYYFLSDDEGTMYYATTFEEHKKNKLLYLR